MSKLFFMDGEQIKLLDQIVFENEALLQDLLERFPQVIALDDIGVTEPFIVIGREVETKAGFIDVLCIDGNGVLTVIETKLARNSQIQREVIGQILEYVAQLTKWQAQDVVALANKYIASQYNNTGDSTKTLRDLLMREQGEEAIEISIEEKIATNLIEGKIKLVIASDKIPDTLKDTVIFINNFSKFDIYVLQIQSYHKDQLQIYAPTVFGYTRKTIGDRTSDGAQWDEKGFLESIKNLDQEAYKVAKDLYAFCKEEAEVVKWGEGKYSSYGYNVKSSLKNFNIFMFENIGDNGQISIYFGAMKGVVAPEELHVFRQKLNQLPGVNLSTDMVDKEKYPSIPLKSLLIPKYFELFKEEVLRLQEIARKPLIPS